MVKKKGKVWIETVIYTLIALVLIGTVLVFAKPKIEQMQDKSLLEQSLQMMTEIDGIIRETAGSATGNQRKIEIGIKKGELTFDGINDKIVFQMQSDYEFSELGEKTFYGDFEIITEETASTKTISITRDYSDVYDLKFQDDNKEKIISKGGSIQKILVYNKGNNIQDGISCAVVSECTDIPLGYLVFGCEGNTCKYISKKEKINFEMS